MTGRRAVVVFFAAILLTAWSTLAQDQDPDGFVALQPESIVPETGEGMTRLWIKGGVDEPGIYVVRNTFPAGVTQPAAFSQRGSLRHGDQGDVVGRLRA